jgi:hypothetical protein
MRGIVDRQVAEWEASKQAKQGKQSKASKARQAKQGRPVHFPQI